MSHGFSFYLTVFCLSHLYGIPSHLRNSWLFFSSIMPIKRYTYIYFTIYFGWYANSPPSAHAHNSWSETKQYSAYDNRFSHKWNYCTRQSVSTAVAKHWKCWSEKKEEEECLLLPHLCYEAHENPCQQGKRFRYRIRDVFFPMRFVHAFSYGRINVAESGKLTWYRVNDESFRWP